MKRNIILILALSFLQVITPLSLWRGAWGEAGSWGEAFAGEKVLSRHVLAVPQTASGSKYLVSWRMIDTDDDYTTFDVLRNGIVVAADINNATNFLDPNGSKTAKYQIVTKKRGKVVDTTTPITPWQGVFNTLKLDRPADGTFHDKSFNYSPNDCSVADADGDGTLELLVKWEPSNPADNSQGGFTGPTIFDCYKIIEADGKMTAQKLWRIDMGHNIRSGPHYVPFLFYDFDGDGKAEFVVKTGPGTKDGAGRYVSSVADEAVIRSVNNEKEYLNGGGQVMYGPEFLTIFNGLTGAAIHTVYYNPNRGCFVGGAPEGRFDIWGDDYGNRSERYLATVAHLDAQNPTHASAVMCRGYYTRAYLWAVDFDGSKLSTRWRHASLSNKTVMTTSSGSVSGGSSTGSVSGNSSSGHVSGGSSAGVTKDVRTYTRATYANTTHCTAYSQGNHNISCADVDGDGMDEIIYGSAAIDHDGTLLWSTGLNHGDALHVGDLLPDRPGLEVFEIHEDPPFGMHICDAATGELIIHMTGDGDTARGIAGDFTPQRGYEFCYFGDGSTYNATTGAIVGPACAQNFRLYWDGDLYDEILNDKGGGHNQPFMEKYNNGGIAIDGKRLFEHGYTQSCNGTKTSPCLSADILGDWREELIFYNGNDKTTLNIFSTSLPSDTRVPCLLYDHVYRLGIAWQNVGYNQPPHLGYYLPDAVAPRLSAYNERAIHYANCTGATLVSVTAPDGTVSDGLPEGITMSQDKTLCVIAFHGQAPQQGQWQITVASTGSSNGTETTATFALALSGTDGIEDIDAQRSQSTIPNSDDAIYDLSGRRLSNSSSDIFHSPTRKGVYIHKGKKVFVK